MVSKISHEYRHRGFFYDGGRWSSVLRSSNGEVIGLMNNAIHEDLFPVCHKTLKIFKFQLNFCPNQFYQINCFNTFENSDTTRTSLPLGS